MAPEGGVDEKYELPPKRGGLDEWFKSAVY